MGWRRRRWPPIERRQEEVRQPSTIDPARLRVATHEATHAVIALLQGRPVAEVRIGSRFGDAAGEFRGRVDPKRTQADDNKLRENLAFIAEGLNGHQVFDHLIGLLGPLAFEAGHELPDYFATCEDDLLLARTIAQAVMATPEACNKLMYQALSRAADLVDRHHADILALAFELEARGCMNGDEVETFLRRECNFVIGAVRCADRETVWRASNAVASICASGSHYRTRVVRAA